MTDERGVSMRLSHHDPDELNELAKIVTGAAGERHPLFSVRYGIAVAILESDWLKSREQLIREGIAAEFVAGGPKHPYNDDQTVRINAWCAGLHAAARIVRGGAA